MCTSKKLFIRSFYRHVPFGEICVHLSMAEKIGMISHYSDYRLQWFNCLRTQVLEKGCAPLGVWHPFTICTVFLPTALALEEVMKSPLSVSPSVRLFPLYLWSRLTVARELLCASRSHVLSMKGIESQGHRSRSRSWVKLMRSVRPRSRAVFIV